MTRIWDPVEALGLGSELKDTLSLRKGDDLIAVSMKDEHGHPNGGNEGRGVEILHNDPAHGEEGKNRLPHRKQALEGTFEDQPARLGTLRGQLCHDGRPERAPEQKDALGGDSLPQPRISGAPVGIQAFLAGFALAPAIAPVVE